MADISKITLPSGISYDIKDAVARQMISGGVSFTIAWDGTSTPVVGDIPAGVVVKYNSVDYTGTLTADNAEPGSFYLVKSSTSPSGQTIDIYDEYVPVGTEGNKAWEKIGDTQLNLTDVVTDVSLTKQTDTVIGTDATFTITQPTISMSTSSSSGTGKIPIVTGISSVTPGGDDDVTVVTGYSNTSSDNFVQTLSSTTRRLATTTVTGVTGQTTASKATAAANQTTADGTYTQVSAGQTANQNILCNISYDDANEKLIINACTLDTQTTTQQTFADVTVPIANVTATTVATGSTTSSGSGAQFVTNIAAGSTKSALTGLGSPTTDTVLGVDTTFGGQASTAYAGATASGANTQWNSKDSVTVLTNATTVTVTKGGS